MTWPSMSVDAGTITPDDIEKLSGSYRRAANTVPSGALSSMFWSTSHSSFSRRRSRTILSLGVLYTADRRVDDAGHGIGRDSGTIDGSSKAGIRRSLLIGTVPPGTGIMQDPLHQIG